MLLTRLPSLAATTRPAITIQKKRRVADRVQVALDTGADDDGFAEPTYSRPAAVVRSDPPALSESVLV